MRRRDGRAEGYGRRMPSRRRGTRKVERGSFRKSSTSRFGPILWHTSELHKRLREGFKQDVDWVFQVAARSRRGKRGCMSYGRAPGRATRRRRESGGGQAHE